METIRNTQHLGLESKASFVSAQNSHETRECAGDTDLQAPFRNVTGCMYKMEFLKTQLS